MHRSPAKKPDRLSKLNNLSLNKEPQSIQPSLSLLERRPSSAAHRDVAAPSLARAARPPLRPTAICRLFRPTGGGRYGVSWALGRGPSMVPLLLPQVVEEQHHRAGHTPLPLLQGAVGTQAIRRLVTR